MSGQPPSKRQRLDVTHAEHVRAQRSAFLSSLSRSISPPRNGKNNRATPECFAGTSNITDGTNSEVTDTVQGTFKAANAGLARIKQRAVQSPFQLSRVRGLSSSDNIDTVSLHDILGDPLIREAWIFNFCFDVGWTMQHFDADVRHLVSVKIVHGSWRKEDGNRIGIEQDLKTWKNVQAIEAYLPDPFGTHHSKMMVLFKHDDTAQVVIHTANMLEKDWDHMTQAVWRSPILPKMPIPEAGGVLTGEIGTGRRFKHGLLRYMKAYGAKLRPLTEQLNEYDFSAVRAALVASVPSNVKVSDSVNKKWGHLALREVLHSVASSKLKQAQQQPQHLICQVSSIATLPATWLSETIVKAATTAKHPPSTSIIYPTPSDLREAITGYATGGSIHTKIESPAQQKQVTSLRPQLHRWGVQQANPATQAGRHLIPPHIKTYTCFSNKPTTADPTPDIDWVLVTSANLSQQAWGTAAKLPKGVKDPDQAVSRTSSFEIGVLVWPELFLDHVDGEVKGIARMVPTFGKDTPEILNNVAQTKDDVVVGVRMPYDLPLTPYGPNEMPWSPSATYAQPDKLGQTWT